MPHPKVSASDKFWTKVVCDPPCRCWRFASSITASTGYGTVRVDGRMVLAHRLAYLLLVGPIPPGMQIHHTCRNRACVNPDHLELLTVEEHWNRHGREACPHGHPLEFTPSGTRRCKECRRLWQQRKRATLPPATRPPGRPRSTVCVNGHPLTDGNVYEWVSPTGRVVRSCYLCRIDAARRYRRRRKAQH